MNIKFSTLTVALASVFVLGSCGSSAEGETNAVENEVAEVQEELNIYTDRHYEVDRVLYDLFEAETGIKVNILPGNPEELLSRMKNEGDRGFADIYFTADVARLYQAQAAGFFQNSSSAVLDSIIPSYLREENGQWYGLTKRARIIAYAKDRVDTSMLSTYEDLANAKWKGKIAVRASNNVYNQSLLASIIANDGEEAALAWATAVVANMYQAPSGNDRDQVKAVFAEKADLAIVNTYYVGKLLNSEDPLEKEAGESVNIYFPNQSGRGTHINISGLGILNGAKNAENAMKLIEFLAQEKAQEQLAEANYEFPVNKNVPASQLVQSWGTFKEDTLSLQTIGELNATAIQLFDKAGWK